MRQFKPYFYIITFFFTTVWAPSFAAETARASKELLTLSAHFSPTEDERNSGAVVLQKHVSYKPKDNGKSETTVHSIIALLDKRAVSDYSTISLAYNEHYSSLTLEYARARNPDGPISTPSADAIQTISPTKGLIYSNDKLLQFSLPGLGAFGSIQGTRDLINFNFSN